MTSFSAPSGFLKSLNKDSAYRSSGYLVLREFLTSYEQQELLRDYDQHFPNNVSGLYTTHNQGLLTKNNFISERISNVFAEGVNREFEKARTILGHYLNKSADNGFEMQLHQDWSITFEDRFPVAHLWCPLCDVTRDNGCMFVIPGSHLLFNNLRSGSLGIPHIMRDGDVDSISVAIEMRAGDALIYHPALFHGSYANITAQDRKVALGLVMPEDAPMRYFHMVQDSENRGCVDVYPLSAGSLLGQLPALEKGAAPEGVSPMQRMDYRVMRNDTITVETLIDALAHSSSASR